VRNDRAANGGRLTPGAHKRVEHQQNKRAASNEKHNAKTDAHPRGEEMK
jgi:hypothetical protein